MTSIEWLLGQLGITEEELASSSRERKLSNKRWLVMWFYRRMGKSYPQIGRKIGKDQSSVRYGCLNIPTGLKMLAEEYLCRYVTEVLHQTPDFTPIEPEEKEKPKVTIKVPDYKNNITRFMEVYVDSLKPVKRIRKWDL